MERQVTQLPFVEMGSADSTREACVKTDNIGKALEHKLKLNMKKPTEALSFTFKIHRMDESNQKDLSP